MVGVDPHAIHGQNRCGLLIYSELTIHTATSTQTYRMTAEKGASSGTEMTLKGCSISEVRMTLKVTLFPLLIDYLNILSMNFNSKIAVIDNGTGYTKMGYAGNT